MKSKDSPERVSFDEERIKYWLSVGAQPTNRVAKFLSEKKLVEKPVVYEQTKKNKPKAKTLEKIKAKEEKLQNKQAQPAEAPKPAQEAQPAEAPNLLKKPNLLKLQNLLKKPNLLKLQNLLKKLNLLKLQTCSRSPTC